VLAYGVAGWKKIIRGLRFARFGRYTAQPNKDVYTITQEAGMRKKQNTTPHTKRKGERERAREGERRREQNTTKQKK
jgi:hypothetical protein